MKTVRYFGREVDPELYRYGFGWRGAVIHLLNCLRIALERQVVIWIASVELAKAKIPPEARKGVIEEVKVDPALNPDTEAPLEGTRPRTLLRSLMEQSRPAGSRTELAELRYASGRKASHQDDVELRPRPLEQGIGGVFADYESRRGVRAARYYRGRKHRAETPEGVFEPVTGGTHMNDSSDRGFQKAMPYVIHTGGMQQPPPEAGPGIPVRPTAQENFLLGQSRHLRLPTEELTKQPK